MTTLSFSATLALAAIGVIAPSVTCAQSVFCGEYFAVSAAESPMTDWPYGPAERAGVSREAVDVALTVEQIRLQSMFARLMQNAPSTFARDSLNLVIQYVRQTKDSVASVEKALRIINSGAHLMAVPESSLTNPRLRIVDLRTAGPARFYLHMSGEGPDVAARHRTELNVGDQRANLQNLDNVGALFLEPRNPTVGLDVAEFANQLDRLLGAGIPTSEADRERLTGVALNRIVQFLADNVDVEPLEVERQLRSRGSRVHLFAVHRSALGPSGWQIIPVPNRFPSNTPYFLQVALLAPEDVERVQTALHLTPARNLELLNEAGLAVPAQ